MTPTEQEIRDPDHLAHEPIETISSLMLIINNEQMELVTVMEAVNAVSVNPLKQGMYKLTLELI